MKNTLYKFYQISEIDLDKLEDNKEYGFTFISGNLSSVRGEILKHLAKKEIDSILLPVEQKPFITDEAIEKSTSEHNSLRKKNLKIKKHGNAKLPNKNKSQ